MINNANNIQALNLMQSEVQAYRKWGYMAAQETPGKKKFKQLIKKASQPVPKEQDK